MARKLDDLRAQIDADPQRRARVNAEKRAMYASLRLAELRRGAHMTQRGLADAMGVSQARVSQIEHGENMELNTVSQYVAAIGGSLRMTITFPDATVDLTED